MLDMLCKYKREGTVSGHWCDQCPQPLAEYLRLEKAEILAWKERNKSKKKRNK
jgi:hypothetical protein